MAEREKVDKPKANAHSKQIPKDAQVVMSILKELNIQEYEPRVINQLLEFSYRYVTCILDDAKVFANHARKKTIDLEDVKLATEVVLDKSFTCPPPRHVLTKLAEVRNAMPLPPIKPHCGLRLPPDRYCLTGCNYKLRGALQPKKMTKSALENRSLIKSSVKVGANTGGPKRGNVIPPKAQVVNIPKPVIKFSKPIIESKTLGDVEEMDIDAANASAVGSISGNKLIHTLKREREEDDFEMV